MGKKSKNPNKTSTSNLVENDLLQELQSNITSLSMQDAINAVNIAKETINKLKISQQAALDDVLKASKSLNNAKDKQKNAEVNNNKTSKSSYDINNYGNEDYWEDRYSSKSTNKDGHDTYEWYVSFNELKDKLFKDIFISGFLPSNKNDKEFNNKILVTGCGNSTICEDLVNVGFNNVYGMDYSESVINNMINRIKDNNNLLKCCHYFQADCLNMKSEKSGSYNTIFDKGTLDAITSNDSGDSSENNDKGILNAAAYMREVWRLLPVGGKFLIVTTMPNDIFDTIAIEPIGGYVCSNWNNNKECKKIKMTTTAGGEIYYYSIMKISTANLASEYKANKNKPKSNSNQDIMSGIQAILLEAAEAKKQMDEALKQVEKSQLKADAAMRSMNETEAYRKVLEKKLEKSTDDIEKEERDKLAKSSINLEDDELGEIVDDEPRFKYEEEEVEDIVHPNVTIYINESSSNMTSRGFIDIHYVIQDGNWDDDDQLFLHCTINNDNNNNFIPSSLYPSEDKQAYESMEYTLEPQLIQMRPIFPNNVKVNTSSLSSSHLHGHLKFPLPVCGGYFYISYQRMAGKGNNRKLYELSISNSFSISCPIFQCKPDVLLPNNKSVRRRGNGSITTNTNEVVGLDMLVEDLKNIQTINIIGLLPLISKNNKNIIEKQYLNRIMAWSYKKESSNDYNIVILIIEADIITVTCNDIDSHQEVAINTVYGRVEIDDFNIDFLHNLAFTDNSQCEIDISGRIVCRVPYCNKVVKDPLCTICNTNMLNEEITIACQFCSSTLFNSLVKEINHLPTGVFDNLMHDFMCCEETPVQALSSSDIISKPSSILIGTINIILNPIDMVKEAIQLSCKTSSTMLDLVLGYGGVIATSNNTSIESNNKPMNLVDIDTCLINCNRCGSYLGDGQMAFSEENQLENNYSFIMEDLRDVRLNLSNILIKSTSKSRIHESIPSTLSIEQTVARIILHLSNSYGVLSFCFFDSDHVNNNKFIIIRILSREYRVNSEGNIKFNDIFSMNYLNQNEKQSYNKLYFQNALKLTYCSSINNSNYNSLLKGNETRVPLQNNEFKSIYKILTRRSYALGKSMIKNNEISYLYY